MGIGADIEIVAGTGSEICNWAGACESWVTGVGSVSDAAAVVVVGKATSVSDVVADESGVLFTATAVSAGVDVVIDGATVDVITADFRLGGGGGAGRVGRGGFVLDEAGTCNNKDIGSDRRGCIRLWIG